MIGLHLRARYGGYELVRNTARRLRARPGAVLYARNGARPEAERDA